MMADGIKIIADENGLFNIYDDTYDVIIHCESEEEQNMVMETLKKTANPWIPITERLPETGDYILISFDNFPVRMIQSESQWILCHVLGMEKFRYLCLRSFVMSA